MDSSRFPARQSYVGMTSNNLPSDTLEQGGPLLWHLSIQGLSSALWPQACPQNKESVGPNGCNLLEPAPCLVGHKHWVPKTLEFPAYF